MSDQEFDTVDDWLQYAVLPNENKTHPAFPKETVADLAKNYGVTSLAQHQVIWQSLTDAAHDYDNLAKLRPFHEYAQDARDLAKKLFKTTNTLISLLDQEEHDEALARIKGLVVQEAFSVIENADEHDRCPQLIRDYAVSADPLGDLADRLKVLNQAVSAPHIPSPDGKPVADYAMAVFVRRLCNLCEHGLNWNVSVDPNIKVLKSTAGKFIFECARQVGDTSEAYVLGQMRKYRSDTKRPRKKKT